MAYQNLDYTNGAEAQARGGFRAKDASYGWDIEPAISSRYAAVTFNWSGLDLADDTFIVVGIHVIEDFQNALFRIVFGNGIVYDLFGACREGASSAALLGGSATPSTLLSGERLGEKR